MKRRTLEQRFWSKVIIGDVCWLWTDKLNQGYGRLLVDGRLLLAHRISWEMSFGPIPKDRQVLHHCDVRACVRPDHLFLGDNAANVQDRVAKGRSGGAKGARNAHAKLTDTQVSEIRQSYQPSPNGRPPKGQRSPTTLLAERYGVTPSTIYHIARGWTWH